MLITTIQVIILTLFLFYIVKRFGVITSISDSAYFLERNKRVYFTATLWSIGFLNFLQPMEMYGALAASMLFFTGATIVFKNDDGFSPIVHYVSAVVAIVLSFVGLILMHGIYIPFISVVIGSGVIYYADKKNFIWWFEVLSFYVIMVAYYKIHL